MTLLFVFGMVTVALFALFWGGGMIAQGYFYQQPADRMPIRAAIGALLVGAFVTIWVWIDKRSPGRYDTFFDFAPERTVEFTEFEAVRWVTTGDGQTFKTDASGNPVEVTVHYKRSAGGKGSRFLEDKSGEPFTAVGSTGSTQYMTGAIRVKAEGDAEPVRYNALIEEDPRTKMKTYTNQRRYVEQKGDRYIEEQQLGTLFVPSSKTVVVSLLLNVLLFVIWMAAFWPILRFSFTHALIMTAVFGLMTMLLVMPLLFKPNRVPQAPAPPPPATKSQ